jgi:hypothetical protein
VSLCLPGIGCRIYDRLADLKIGLMFSHCNHVIRVTRGPTDVKSETDSDVSVRGGFNNCVSSDYRGTSLRKTVGHVEK